LEETENEYLAAIEKFSKLVESSEEYIDPEFYQLYQEKLALLDEFILQCQEAVRQNEYNINARKYLALAYKEKKETLQALISLKDKVDDLRPFKGRATLITKIWSSYDFLRLHKTDPVLEALLLKERTADFEEGVELEVEKYRESDARK